MPIEQYFQLPGFTIDEVLRSPPDALVVKASSNSTKAECPSCHNLSRKKHSTYARRPKGLPWGQFSIRLYLTVQRYFCENTNCSQVTFAERVPEIAPLHAQRTVQLTKALRAIAFEASAEAVGRISHYLHIPISADTVLRILRSTPYPERSCPRVLGVDDWALKRGQNYGTILVDLETHKPVDLLRGRTADTLKQWLEAHPEVQIIAGDRSKEYKAGIDGALPNAIQIVDRWHLYLNLREKIEKTLAKRTGQAKKSTKTTASPRQKRYENVRYLHARGYSTRTIARALDMNRGTVTRYFQAEHLPDANFVAGLRQDYQAVKAALHYEWSNGQTEGQVTRLKMIKRQMYGRANFDLLRIRVLGPP